MELRQLRYFIAVAEELHFSRAAVRLHMAQPPLSRQISLLETELHTKLFWRNKRRVELTAAGRAFLEEARRTLAQADQAVRVAELAAAGETAQLQLGFIDSALYGFLPRYLRAIRQHHPAVQIVLHELTSGQQVEALKRSELHIAMLRPTRGGPQLLFHEVARERMLVALPHGHRLSALTEVPVEALRDEEWIMFPRLLSPGLHDYLIGLCRRAGFTPRVAQQGHEGHTIVGLVGAGLGVAMLPESLQHWGGPEVDYRPVRAASPWLPMCVAWRKDERSSLVRSCVEIAKTPATWSQVEGPREALTTSMV